MKKLLFKMFITCVIAFGFMSLFMFTMPSMAAADIVQEQTEQEDATDNESKTDEEKKKTVDDFIALLKEKYGADYETEYNKIIEKWGSVETYLLSLADSEIVPDVAKDGFTSFVQWLSDYAPIWATFLAIVFAVILVVREARKQHKLDILINKVQKLIKGQNALTEGQLATLTAQRKLLGTSSKSEDERQAIDKAQDTLNQDI